MSREIGIPWSDPMVLANLAGTKTQTRRILKTGTVAPVKKRFEDWGDGTWGSCATDGTGSIVQSRYRVGDLLWGREAWGVAFDGGWVDGFTLNYRADKYQMPIGPRELSMVDTIGKIKTLHEKWRPPMFFPRWAARLFHTATTVRVERLLDISEADALAEGIERVTNGGGLVAAYRWPNGGTQNFTSARAAYLAGFDSINGVGASKANPWVFVIGYRPWDPTLEHDGGCTCVGCRFRVLNASEGAGW